LTLSEEIATLTTDLETAKDDGNKAKTEVEGLLKKVAALDREVEHLESKNNDLLGKQSESKKAMQAVQSLKNENAQLKTTVEELKASNSTSSAVGGSSGNKEATLALEEKIVGLETALQEWTDLAKVR
jgi:phage host-nuclease inhibitor protein Gam